MSLSRGSEMVLSSNAFLTGGMCSRYQPSVAITSATVPTYGEEQDLDAVRALAAEPGRPVAMPACPLMHGTGWFMMLQNLSVGGLVVTLENRHLDIPELFDTIEAEGVQMIVIVGDAFAKPMLRAAFWVLFGAWRERVAARLAEKEEVAA